MNFILIPAGTFTIMSLQLEENAGHSRDRGKEVVHNKG
jgi:hypothetical protein